MARRPLPAEQAVEPPLTEQQLMEYLLKNLSDAASEPTLHRIQNPAARLHPTPIQEIRYYKINHAEWRQQAEQPSGDAAV
ncbi:MAG: hypothetical protein ACK4P5_10795 [Fimbriimonadales bacterium]